MSGPLLCDPSHAHATARATLPCDRRCWIVRLSGFLGRRGDDRSGVTVLWKGFQQLRSGTGLQRLDHGDLASNAPPYLQAVSLHRRGWSHLRLLSKNICGSCTSRSKRFTITVSHSNNESISCKNGWTKHLAGIFIKKPKPHWIKSSLKPISGMSWG